MGRQQNSGAAPSEVLRGEVAEVRVIREGWGKMRLRSGEDITGTVLGFGIGDTIEARGKWAEDPKWGRQFKAATIRCSLAADNRGAIAWLSSRLPGLGQKRAAELVERFGIPQLYAVIEHEPQRLAEVRGITPALAQLIHEEHARVKGETEEMTTLLGWGLTDGQIKRCKEAWGKETLTVLRADPYRLAEEVYGFGFQRSDVIARKMGLPPDHPRRLQACCLHVLREAEGEGECYVTRGLLLKVALEELAAASVQLWQVAEQLDQVLEEGRAVQVAHESGHPGRARLYLPDTRAAELHIAERLRRLVALDGTGGRVAA